MDTISELLSQFKNLGGGSNKSVDLSKLLNTNARRSPAGDLLLALRPYLNEKRRAKVKDAVSILSLTQIFDVFKTFGGD